MSCDTGGTTGTDAAEGGVAGAWCDATGIGVAEKCAAGAGTGRGGSIVI